MEIIIALLAVILAFFLGVLINLLADYLPEDRYWNLQKYYEKQKAEGKYEDDVPQYFPEGYTPTWHPHYPDGTLRPLSAWSGIIAFLTGNHTSPHNEEATMSWRYPLTELVMMGMFALVTLGWPDHERMHVWLIFISLLMLITIIDIEHRIILFYQNIVPGALLAILFAFLVPADLELQDYLIGGAVGYGTFWLFYLGGQVFSSAVQTDEVAFGYGDVTLAMLCGLMIGWQLLVFAMMITVFAGAAGAVLYMAERALRQGGYSVLSALPYGPYVVFGTVVMMLGGEDVANLLAGG